MDKCKIYEANGLWYLSSEELTNCGGFTDSLSAVQSAEAFGYTDIEVVK